VQRRACQERAGPQDGFLRPLSGWCTCWSAGCWRGSFIPPAEVKAARGRAPLPGPRSLSSGSVRSPRARQRAARRWDQDRLCRLLDRDQVRAGDDRGADRRGAPRPGAGGAGPGQDCGPRSRTWPWPWRAGSGTTHALMCRPATWTTPITLEAMIARLDAQIEAMMTPFQAARDLLTTASRHRPRYPPPQSSPRSGAMSAEFSLTLPAWASWDRAVPGQSRIPPGNGRSGKPPQGQRAPAVSAGGVRPGPQSATTATSKSLCHRHVMKMGAATAARPPRRKPSSSWPTPWPSSSGTSWPPESPTTKLGADYFNPPPGPRTGNPPL